MWLVCSETSYEISYGKKINTCILLASFILMTWVEREYFWIYWVKSNIIKSNVTYCFLNWLLENF